MAAEFTPNSNLYKWKTSDQKQTTIQEMANNAEKIDDKFSEIGTQLVGNANKTASIYNVKENEHLKVVITEGYDWTPAIQYTIDNAPVGALVVLPPFETITTDTINTNGRRLSGAGMKISIIRPRHNKAAIMVSGRAQYVSDLAVKRDILSTDVPILGVGILLDRVSDASVFERLDFVNCSAGIYSKDPVGTAPNNYVYSVSFRDIRVYLFSHSGIYLGSEGGNTGCVLQNIYIVNRVQEGSVGSPQPAKYGIYLKAFSEIVGIQLNVEHGNYDYPIILDYCENVKFSSLHFEGLKPLINHRSVVRVQGSRKTNLRLDSISLAYCTFDNVVAAFLIVDNGAKVVINGLSARDNTLVNNPFVRLFSSDVNLTSEASIEINGLNEITATFNTSDNLGSFTVPILKKKNENFNSFTLFGKTVISSDAIPTTGTWKVGDLVLKINPVPGNYIGYVCTTAGSPGTWKAFGAILA